VALPRGGGGGGGVVVVLGTVSKERTAFIFKVNVGNE
jgi:hypothetical protein